MSFSNRLPALLLAALVGAAGAQERPPERKPVLIRPDKTPRIEEAVTPDPARAREHVEVGNFYFKRGNYRAAEERFRAAVKHAPAWATAYQRLIDALEKQQQYRRASEVCRQFVQTNPEAPEVEEFEKKSKDLEKKQNLARQ